MSDFSAVLREYRLRFPDGDCRENELMSMHTSFRIGGPARIMFIPKSAGELRYIADVLKRNGVKTLLMGNGTNLLVDDAPLDIVVIKTAALGNISVCENRIRVDAGALLSRIASAARDNALTGMEFAHGIPGTLGGAVYMNAGAYGGEMKDIVLTVDVLREDFTEHIYCASECDFSYRHSRFSDSGEFILSAEIELSEGDKELITSKMEELSRRRREKQPLDMPSAGSTFKRPENGYAAALIEEAGLKGFSIGGAQVSEKHAGFVINRGGASFNDVIRLMEYVKDRVYKASGIELSPEVRIIRN